MNLFNHKIIFSGSIVEIEQMDVEISNHQRHTYQVIRHPGGAAVLPVHDDGTVSLICQARPAVEKKILEIPAGRRNPSESELICAGRELLEETGLTATTMIPLGIVYSSPGVFDEIIYLFAATGLSQGLAEPEDDEEIEVLRLPFVEVLQMVADGRISDAKTMAALFRWELMCRTQTI